MATMTSAAPPTAPKTEFDSATGTPKQTSTPQMPFMNNSTMQAPVQLTPEAMKPPAPQTVTDTTQGNEAVLKTAQETALNQSTSPISGLVEQRTAQYLQDPNLGYDPKANITNQMDQYNADQSKAMEATRQQLANTSQSGELQNEFLKNALDVSQGRANLQSTLNQQAADTTQKNYLNALAQGREGMTAQQGETTSQIGNLATVRGMAEGERAQTTGFQENVELTKMGFSHDEQMAAVNNGYDLAKMEKAFGYEIAKMTTASSLDTASKTELMNLQDKITTGQLLKTQDFEAIQNNLDRLEKEALQKGDIAGQININYFKGQLDLVAQQEENKFLDKQRSATQSWQTGERIDNEKYRKAEQYYDWAKKDAEQKNDINAQKTIEGMREKTQLAMQTNEMGQEEKMAYLTAQLDDAKANNDVGRQETIIGFQTTQELEKMYKAGEIDQANIKVKATVDEALAQNDWVRATATQNAAFVHDGLERAKDRVIEQARTDLQAKGVNIDALFKAYEAGTVSADSVLNLVKSAGKELGVSVSAPDPMATEEELTKEFKQNQLQYALSHPEFAKYDAQRNVVGILDTPEAQKSFNDFFNSTLYNDKEIGSSEAKPIVWDSKSQSTNEKAFATTPPPVGSYIKYNGKTYKVSSEVAQDSSPQGGGRLQFSAVDIGTGSIVTIKAGQ